MSNFISRVKNKVMKKYPRLMVSQYSGSVYMMTSANSGTKLYQGASGINSCYSVGTHKDHWHDHNMVDFEGDLVLTSPK